MDMRYWYLIGNITNLIQWHQ